MFCDRALLQSCRLSIRFWKPSEHALIECFPALVVGLTHLTLYSIIPFHTRWYTAKLMKSVTGCNPKWQMLGICIDFGSS
jgi:hypothetical protein